MTISKASLPVSRTLLATTTMAALVLSQTPAVRADADMAAVVATDADVEDSWTIDLDKQSGKTWKANLKQSFCETFHVRSLCKGVPLPTAAERKMKDEEKQQKCVGTGCCAASRCYSETLPGLGCNSFRGERLKCIGGSISKGWTGTCQCPVGACSAEGRCNTGEAASITAFVSKSAFLKERDIVPREDFTVTFLLYFLAFLSFLGGSALILRRSWSSSESRWGHVATTPSARASASAGAGDCALLGDDIDVDGVAARHSLNFFAHDGDITRSTLLSSSE